ncbi:class I SAM-dependent methyltransferase [Cesiribacter andamanensis]|uniref:Bifunctional 3-demethylubiquinone-9 3-methyltransferase/ 2-octaprenyl-6-hydroxy phenol methylase n=1 Tax=Cesiribacter andamanensis AMV16 TaxID=1279009 RepID=M7N782_9BACT|nr:class I SAM-dependent methyltransferase [Cesiribacter andamanensis]EMR03101.1 bifunctional 3-demethylubiquinone-9 3-methyltransferase/ 2-octaprenyl-6-hydroxy phenol methylase [Cesiribacter andamanensis AMV16]
MHQQLQHCPLCHSGQFRLFISSKDYNLSQERFTIEECQQCRLLFTNPRPTEAELGKYYESATYISHTDQGNTLVNRAYKLVREYTLRQKVALIQKWSPQGELLDIGCGTGHFLAKAKEKGWQVEGVEINEGARAQAESRLAQALHPLLRNIPATRRFQAITLWHVLEHVYDLSETMTQLKDLLHKQGSLFIAVPNPQSYDAQYYGAAWAAWDVPRHLYHFNQEVMQRLAKKWGFAVKGVAPMRFDAFYVSLLSEGYKHGRTNYLKAISTGLKSNLWASNHQNNYSSLIYILQHA